MNAPADSRSDRIFYLVMHDSKVPPGKLGELSSAIQRLYHGSANLFRDAWLITSAPFQYASDLQEVLVREGKLGDSDMLIVVELPRNAANHRTLQNVDLAQMAKSKRVDS